MLPFLISLDFDGTLFDSPGRLRSLSELKQIDKDAFSAALQKFRKETEFLPDKFANFLHKQGLLSLTESIALHNAFLTIPRDAAGLVYPDALRFISTFPKETMVIISRAHPEWQRPIIENSGLGDKVRDIYITQGDLGKRQVLESLLLHFKKIFHIDDQPDEIARLAGMSRVVPIFLNRGLKSEAISGYKSLDEVKAYIEACCLANLKAL